MGNDVETSGLLFSFYALLCNLLQLGRYGDFGEQRYRQQFGRKFDWLSFNASLAESQISVVLLSLSILVISVSLVNALPISAVFNPVV